MIVYKAITEAKAHSLDTYIIEIEVEPEDVKFYRHNSVYDEDEYCIEPDKGRIISIYEKWSLAFTDEVVGRRAIQADYYTSQIYTCGKCMSFKTWVWMKRETAYLYGMGFKTWEWVKKSYALRKLAWLERWCRASDVLP